MEVVGRKSNTTGLKIVLDVMWYLSFAGLIFVGFLMVQGVITNGSGTMTVPVVFELEEGIYRIQAVTLGIESADLSQATAELSFDVPVAWLFHLNLMVAVLGLLIIIWVLFHLRAVLATLSTGTPFVEANAARIRWIGIAIISGEVLKSVAVGLEHYYVMTNFTSSNIHFGASLDIQGAILIVGFTVIVISEIFRRGTKLQQDSSVTV